MQIQIEDDNSQSFKNSKNTIARVKTSTKISKKKPKKQPQVLWIPFLQKNNLNSDQEPVYLFYFRKFMKSYENVEYNKYRSYGLTDAGVGRIEQIKLDKINENLQISMSTYSTGIKNFQYLIELYKSYQDQQYYELGVLLEVYQSWCQQQNKDLIQYLTQQKIEYNISQSILDEAYFQFEQDIQEWANNNLQNEIYEILIGYANLDLKIPVLKKKIFSKNLIIFMGGDLNSLYQNLFQQNMKEQFSYILNGEEFNGRLQLEKKIQLIKQQMSGQASFSVRDEIITLEGIVVPTMKSSSKLFYNYKNRTFQKEQDYFFAQIQKYSFEANQIKRLMEIRTSQYQLPWKNYQDNNTNKLETLPTDNLITNLDFVCLQEYFLEKFEYI